MKLTPALAALAVLAAAVGPGAASLNAADDQGVALAIVYDTSGSMRDPVPDAAGRPTPKYLIANRALVAITRQIQTFATNTAAGTRKIDTGLFIFAGDQARQAVKFGPFDPAALQNFAGHFSNPHGNTPLGNALASASRVVLESPLPRKHVLIITDGMNTAGPAPEAVLPKLQKRAHDQQNTLSVHFVAFDVDAQQFSGVKRAGATVVGASNEKELNSQLEFILQRKILLEEEEPPRAK
jgi:hypothetical protein